LEVLTKSGQKLNSYQTKDFFCSVTYEVENEDEVIAASELATGICESEIMKDVNALQEKLSKLAEN